MQIVMKPKTVPIIVPISEAVLRPPSLFGLGGEVPDPDNEVCTVEVGVYPEFWNVVVVDEDAAYEDVVYEDAEYEDDVVTPGPRVLYVLGGVGSYTTSCINDILRCPLLGCGKDWQSKA